MKTLSDKIITLPHRTKITTEGTSEIIHLPYIKAFIQELKENIGVVPINEREKQLLGMVKEQIDKLAGGKLI